MLNITLDRHSRYFLPSNLASESLGRDISLYFPFPSPTSFPSRNSKLCYHCFLCREFTLGNTQRWTSENDFIFLVSFFLPFSFSFGMWHVWAGSICMWVCVIDACTLFVYVSVGMFMCVIACTQRREEDVGRPNR